MLDYCPTSSEGGSTGYQNQSPGAMASLLTNMNFNMNLDHTSRQSAFVLSSPPLAALHNMTEMKVPTSSAMLPQGHYSQSTLKQLAIAASQSSTPHGIQDILSRPHLFPRLNAGVYLPHARFSKPLAELPGRAPIYWPGVLPPNWRAPGKLIILPVCYIYTCRLTV